MFCTLSSHKRTSQKITLVYNSHNGIISIVCITSLLKSGGDWGFRHIWIKCITVKYCSTHFDPTCAIIFTEKCNKIIIRRTSRQKCGLIALISCIFLLFYLITMIKEKRICLTRKCVYDDENIFFNIYKSGLVFCSSFLLKQCVFRRSFLLINGNNKWKNANIVVCTMTAVQCWKKL